MEEIFKNRHQNSKVKKQNQNKKPQIQQIKVKQYEDMQQFLKGSELEVASRETNTWKRGFIVWRKC